MHYRWRFRAKTQHRPAKAYYCWTLNFWKKQKLFQLKYYKYSRLPTIWFTTIQLLYYPALLKPFSEIKLGITLPTLPTCHVPLQKRVKKQKQTNVKDLKKNPKPCQFWLFYLRPNFSHLRSHTILLTVRLSFYANVLFILKLHVQYC